jgi:F0F1-type ATP synthase membrane subunit b/b'
MELLHQLGDLVVQALPTVVIVFIFYLCMRALFFIPLQRAMDERARRIDGAKAEAAAAQAAAREELDRYHDALKKARAEVYLEQEAARQAVLDERAKLLRTLRARTLEMVQEAKARIAAESETARAEIEKQTPVLAGQISKMILERSGPSAGGRR